MAPDAIEHEANLDCEPPIQLIFIKEDEAGKEVFDFNPEALEKLAGIDTPLGIFSMCGALRCGKSYLLNCILEFFDGTGVSY